MVLSDYIVLSLYLLGMVAIGLFYATRNKSASDMFAAGGQSPWWVAGLSGFMTMFSAGTFVVWGGVAYKYGVVAISINLAYGVAALIAGYLAAGKWKDLGLRTPAQFIELRFGRAAVYLYTAILMIYRIVGAGIALYALAVLLSALIVLPSGHWLANPETGQLSVFYATVIFGSIIVLYTMAGGLWAVLMTDVVQFIILNLAVIFTVPLIIMQAGGIANILAEMPEGFLSLTGGGYGFIFIAGWVLIHVFMIGAEWAFAQRFMSVSSSGDARKSAYLFGFLYLFSPFLWLAPPLIYRVIDPSANPEEAYILAAKAVLPAGMVGLVIAAMFSATASLVSSQLNVFAGVLTDLLTQKKLKINERFSELTLARVVTVLLGVLLVVLAAAVPSMGGAEKLIIAATSIIAGPLLAPSLWGLLSKRVNMNSIWFVLSGSMLSVFLIKSGLSENGFLVDYTVFDTFSGWVQLHPRLADMVSGVIVPIVILTICHVVLRKDAVGVERVNSQRALTQVSPSVAAVNVEPLIVVIISIAGSGLVMFALALFGHDKKLELWLFASVLIFLALCLTWVVRVMCNKNATNDSN